MTERDQLEKSHFDFYSDVFFYYLFSVFDNIGHVLNNMHALGVEESKVYLKAIIEKLKNPHRELYEKLTTIIMSDEYLQAASMRKAIAHNMRPSQAVGLIAAQRGPTITVSAGEYVTAKETASCIQSILPVLTKSLDFASDYGLRQLYSEA